MAGNTTGQGGGGIYGKGYNAITVSNSTLSGNSAVHSGGGIYGGEYSAITLTNSTLSGNSAAANGGGIYGHEYNTITVVSSTLTGNKALGNVNGDHTSGAGGGIYNFGADGTGATTTLINSIVAGNAAAVGHDLYSGYYTAGGSDGQSDLVFYGGNIIGSSPVNFATTGAPTATIDGASQSNLQAVFASVGNDPHTGVLSGTLADNGGPVETVALNPDAGNPAIDSGDPSFLNETTAGIDLNGDGDTNDVITTDARGFDRDVDFNADGTAAPDLGAFEQQLGQTFVVTTLADENDAGATVANPGETGLSLREALVLANQDPTSPDTITFDPSLIGGNTPGHDGVLTLSQGELSVAGNVIIEGDVNGDHVADITIDGNNASRIFDIDDGNDATT
ncbi:MAG TPA: choice-of-anchor Q domain-containing protein, partial [Thermomicrobiales bacterium]|nr:choice-of-anchor Q domain-containing protein [Thermomicrobiales bacterium]